MIARPGEITDQVFRLIRDSYLVIADLTDGNPNVMYELGLRHTLKLPTIQIGEYSRLPFDVSVIRTIRFTRTPAGMVDARKQLESAVGVALEGDFDLVTATRVWESPAQSHDTDFTSDQRLKHESSQKPDEELGTIELLAEMESAMPELVSLTDRMNVALAGLTERMETVGSQVETSDSNKEGFAGRPRVANRTADLMTPTADELEALAATYETRMASIDLGMTCLLDAFESQPEELRQAGDFTNMITEFARVVRSSAEQYHQFASNFGVLGKFSRPLRVAVRRILDATNRIMNAMRTVEKWESRLNAITALNLKSQSSMAVTT